MPQNGLKMEKLPKNDTALPEVLFANGDKSYSYYLSELAKRGLIRRVVPRVYTSTLDASDEDIMKRNLFLIIGKLFPGAVI